MYICLDCYKQFENPETLSNGNDEHFGTPCRESYAGCPYCAGNYTFAHYCSLCGDCIEESYVRTDDGMEYCHNCYEERHILDEVRVG